MNDNEMIDKAKEMATIFMPLETDTVEVKKKKKFAKTFSICAIILLMALGIFGCFWAPFLMERFLAFLPYITILLGILQVFIGVSSTAVKVTEAKAKAKANHPEKVFVKQEDVQVNNK